MFFGVPVEPEVYNINATSVSVGLMHSKSPKFKNCVKLFLKLTVSSLNL
jgi:hypothetical protein